MDFLADIFPLRDRLYRLALRITGRREEAEDCVQETMLRLWDRRDTAALSDNPAAFASTVCRNAALDTVRRHGRQNVALDDTPQTDAPHDPYPTLYARDSLRRVSDILASLPERQRTAMHLRDFDGLPYRDIADIMGITEEQVKVNIFRARKHVRDELRVTNY